MPKLSHRFILACCDARPYLPARGTGIASQALRITAIFGNSATLPHCREHNGSKFCGKTIRMRCYSHIVIEKPVWRVEYVQQQQWNLREQDRFDSESRCGTQAAADHSRLMAGLMAKKVIGAVSHNSSVMLAMP